MSLPKLIGIVFVGLAALFFWNSNLSAPIKSALRATHQSHNHYALTLKVFSSDTSVDLDDVKVQLLSHPEIKLVANKENPETFYLSRKGGWKEQKNLNVNFIVVSRGMFPKLVTAQVGLDCEDEHHEEKVETVTLVPRTLPVKVKYTVEELKQKWKAEGGASLLVDALERNTLDTEMARILTIAKKSDKIENVLVLFSGDEIRELASQKKNVSLAFPGFGGLTAKKSQELRNIPAVLMSGTAEEILLLSNMPHVYFIAKID